MMQNNELTRRHLLGLGTLGLAASLAPWVGAETKKDLPVGELLPELTGVTQWLNSPPLQIADLRGKVVLVNIWTFACINCQRVLPHVITWQKRYEKKGLQVIGIHTPELSFERDVSNVKKAVARLGIVYPVAIDNQFANWKAYNNEYWPHLFLADRTGHIRYDHVGEEAYTETEQAIRTLLG